jgi:hypothetical protein
MKKIRTWVHSVATRVSRRLSRPHRGEHGQVVVLFAPMLLIFAVAGWMVVDVGSAFAARRSIQRTVDIMALAGAQELPANPTLARAKALEWATRNGLSSPPYTITVTTDNTCYNTDPLDDPAVIDSMTTVVTRPADQFFSRVFGISAYTVGAKAKACWGGANIPVDLEIIIDRSSSMSAADMTNAKDAAKSILTLFDPTMQHVAFGVLGPSLTAAGSLCTGANVGGFGLPAGSVTTPPANSWAPVAFSSDFKTGAVLNNSSVLVKTINCLTQSSVGTNLTMPVSAAQTLLTTTGRAGVKKGIIFMTDGAANQAGTNPCKQANTAATAAKAAGIEIFMIGFGVDAEVCNSSSGENGTSVYNNQIVTKLLADMATASLDDHNHCASTADQTAENADGDHFFCAPKTADLTPVFRQAAKAFAGITLVE